ncbi:MAG: cupin domain-containing protein [Proteobacteria bacterium]|nr:cupin domain-containing protein [Pseudomonadota bacterium]MDA1323434.1 cupin domain-containing protein [Pseudomonadota bacterium]
MSQDETYLGGILSAEEFAQFEAARADQKPFRAAGRNDRFSGLFCLADFERLVNQTSIWTPDRLEVFLDTKKVPPQTYYSQLQLHNGLRFRLEPAALQKLLDSGASLVLNDIDGMTEGLKTLRKILAGYSGAKVESNLYYSQPRHRAFAIHFDVHEVFACQIAGEKRWQIYQQAHRFPINHLAFLSGDLAMHEKAKGPLSMDFVMKQGDFIYIPAGYYHQAICTNDISAHLSFSAVEMIGLDVISELFDNGIRDEFFRTPIRRSAGNATVADYLKLLSENIERLATNDAFVQNIEKKLQAFPHSTGSVSIRK